MVQMLGRTRRAWALGLVSAAALLGATKEAAAKWPRTDDYIRRGHREPFCGFFSGPGCTHTIYLDGVLAYNRDISNYPGDPDFMRVGGELGYLVRLGRLYSQVGLAVEGGGLLNDDVKGWYVAPKLRFRWWPLHSFTGVEFAAGAVYNGQHYVQQAFDIRRLGGLAEVGVTFYSAFSLVAGGQLMRDTNGEASGSVFLGMRLTLPFVPYLLIALSGKGD